MRSWHACAPSQHARIGVHRRPLTARTSARCAAARVTALLDGAERVARVGSTFPPLAAFPGLLHYPARWAARLVLFLSRFITDAQAHFNVTVLHALRDLNEAVGRLADLTGDLLEAQDARRRVVDPLHLALHDQFRGPPETIRERLRVYLPLVREAGAKPTARVGPRLRAGRVARSAARGSNWAARGVDLNPAMVVQCQQRGLEVVEAEAIDYLQSQPDASLGAVTAFQLIEHLPFSRSWYSSSTKRCACSNRAALRSSKRRIRRTCWWEVAASTWIPRTRNHCRVPWSNSSPKHGD